MSFQILTLNNIAASGLARLPADLYQVSESCSRPDAILLRSAKMHDMQVADSVRAVARAGAGTNNIPIERMSARGVPVFNAPGANANAVKELVLAGMLLAARNLGPAWAYVRDLDAQDPNLSKAVEQGKKRFVGYELPGKTLGVIGLGAIGVEVANAARALGMKVLGFDPQLTVARAWQLSFDVQQAANIEQVFSNADVISFHVPLNEHTRGLASAKCLGMLKDGSVLLNFARGGIVDESALRVALSEGKVGTYVTDFPHDDLKDHPQVIALPHLGASTAEAEENCAAMVADSLRAFLEHGNIERSVNFPEAVMPRAGGFRLGVAHANVPNMVGQITTTVAEERLNIVDLLNKSRHDVAYTVLDVEGEVSDAMMDRINAIDGVTAASRYQPIQG